MIRTRDAWLAAIAATLGISEEACRAKDNAPAAAREVPSASASASTSVDVAPSASASAVASASQQMLQMIQASCGGTSAVSTGTIGVGTIGTGHNLSCGVSTREMRSNAGPRAEVTVNLMNGGATGDDRVMAALRPRFRNCANQALAQNPTQQGRLIITAVVAANGTVSSASVMTNTGLSEACATCMLRAVRVAQFPVVLERTIQIVVNQTTQQSP